MSRSATRPGRPACAWASGTRTPRRSPWPRWGVRRRCSFALLGRTADPDEALVGLVWLADVGRRRPRARWTAEDEGTAMRLLCVLGASEALSDHLVRHPPTGTSSPTRGSGPPPGRLGGPRGPAARRRRMGDPAPVATRPDAEAVDALRVEYRRVLLPWPPATCPPPPRDRRHRGGVSPTSPPGRSTPPSRSPGRGSAPTRVSPGSGSSRWASAAAATSSTSISDVDVIFVHAAARRQTAGDDAALRVADPAGCQPPDARLLRPHRRGDDLAGRRRAEARGQGGPLVRTIASHRGYYERWAKTWEFQALLKAGRSPATLATWPASSSR